mmetsp:Transcript_3157/g.9761  ORF Transcript_3157/g.9761 Transcript_3157/m.9761 type:complete len:491 (-) Transcript_3157:1146-2618(-)
MAKRRSRSLMATRRSSGVGASAANGAPSVCTRRAEVAAASMRPPCHSMATRARRSSAGNTPRRLRSIAASLRCASSHSHSTSPRDSLVAKSEGSGSDAAKRCPALATGWEAAPVGARSTRPKNASVTRMSSLAVAARSSSASLAARRATAATALRRRWRGAAAPLSAPESAVNTLGMTPAPAAPPVPALMDVTNGRYASSQVVVSTGSSSASRAARGAPPSPPSPPLVSSSLSASSSSSSSSSSNGHSLPSSTPPRSSGDCSHGSTVCSSSVGAGPATTVAAARPTTHASERSASSSGCSTSVPNAPAPANTSEGCLAVLPPPRVVHMDAPGAMERSGLGVLTTAPLSLGPTSRPRSLPLRETRSVPARVSAVKTRRSPLRKPGRTSEASAPSLPFLPDAGLGNDSAWRTLANQTEPSGCQPTEVVLEPRNSKVGLPVTLASASGHNTPTSAPHGAGVLPGLEEEGAASSSATRTVQRCTPGMSTARPAA